MNTQSFFNYDPKIFRNRRAVRGVTIDGPHTQEIDDAIWIEHDQDGNIIVSVSIADVASEVIAGSYDDHEAYRLGFTRYGRHGRVPMLGPLLSGNKLSLVPKRARPAMTVTMVLDDKLEIQKTYIDRTVLINEKQWTYEDFTSAIDTNEPLAKGWFMLVERLLDKRRAKGSVFFYDFEHGVGYDESNKPVDAKPNEFKAYVMVKELMTLANSAVARYALKNDIPFLFRNHYGNGSRAFYGAKCQGHIGLGASAYCHFTSPIRRYADVVNHRQIAAFLDSVPYHHHSADLFRIGTYLDHLAEESRADRLTALFRDDADCTTQHAGQGIELVSPNRLLGDICRMINVPFPSKHIREEGTGDAHKFYCVFKLDVPGRAEPFVVEGAGTTPPDAQKDAARGMLGILRAHLMGALTAPAESAALTSAPLRPRRRLRFASFFKRAQT